MTTSRTTSPSSPSPVASRTNLREAANHLIESANHLVLYVQTPPEKAKNGIEEFVNNFEKFHSTVVELIQKQRTQEQKQSLNDALLDAKEEAIELLERLRTAQADPNNMVLSQVKIYK